MIYTLLSKKRRESHLRTSMGQTAQDAWIGGWGQPNLGNACILGTFDPAIPPIQLCILLAGQFFPDPFYARSNIG